MHNRPRSLLRGLHLIETHPEPAKPHDTEFHCQARVLVLVLSATVISACGRKGDLDRPGVTSGDAAGADGKETAGRGRASFLLDPLL